MNDIEKAARLIGYTVAERKPEFNYYHLDKDTVGTFDPRTNKADLMDLECELEGQLEIRVRSECVEVSYYEFDIGCLYNTAYHSDHPTKFAARAEAVISVCVQIYDAKFGKDRE